MNEIVHILNGDALREVFPSELKGELITFREMMMEGPVHANGIEELVSMRSKFLNKYYDTELEEYYNKSGRELEKILSISESSKVYLWFEYDLFCQVNMWCAIHMLTSWNNVNDIKIVYPAPITNSVDWHGFAAIRPNEISSLLKKSIPLIQSDIELNHKIWSAYTSTDIQALKQLSKEKSEAFPLLHQSIQNHLDRLPINGQPSALNTSISNLVTKHGKENFGAIFKAFSSEYGRYGMGDVQVKRMVDASERSIN
ncbi:MAG: DUF1835 domain-containing protein [Saprospiraceae bacterium]|nr:DUF1835 domain-containing protein [Saprospiraceae bacterium]